MILAALYTQDETEPAAEWGLATLTAYATLNEIDLDGETDLEGVLDKCVAWWEQELN